MIREVTMYRVDCDGPGCDANAQDDGDYYAWLVPAAAEREALEYDWTLNVMGKHLCPDCAAKVKP